MLMSIAHRITGVALYAGTILVAWWLLATASGGQHYDVASGFFGSWFGMLILFGYTWALLHHLLGGIRHFIWDTGHMFENQISTKLAYATIIGSIGLTVLVWIIAFVAS
jgi:succinate dehydrogenase / fumarate reductase cytochrome b subunit